MKMPIKDIEKRREYHKRYHYNYYRRNKIKYKERNTRLKQTTQKWFKEYKKGLRSSRCEENHPSCLEFHHKKDKKMSVCPMALWGYSKKKILEEIQKCIVICSNCHRKEHWPN